MTTFDTLMNYKIRSCFNLISILISIFKATNIAIGTFAKYLFTIIKKPIKFRIQVISIQFFFNNFIQI